MTKPIIERAMEDGLFAKFMSLRDMTMKPETPPHIKYGGTGLEIISTKIDKLRYAGHTDGWTEVVNKDLELVGVIYYWKKWKKLVWEQCPNIIMSKDCMGTIGKIMQKIKGSITR